jgi:hypothetical protein
VITAKFLKMRRAQELARNVADAAKETAWEARHHADRLWYEYLDEGESCGLCRNCLANGTQIERSKCREPHDPWAVGDAR